MVQVFWAGAAIAAVAAPGQAARADQEAQGAQENKDDGMAFFESSVRPILVEHCYGCHSEQSGKRRGGLVLDSVPGWKKGGDIGPAIVPGDPDASPLVQAVRYASDDLQMPPDNRLPAATVKVLEDWVKRGAPDPRTTAVARAAGGTVAPRPQPIVPPDLDSARQHFAFTPLAAPPLPGPFDVASEAWVRGPIDRFVLAGLQAAHLAPAPEADRHTLIRRATFDLTGLPPTAQEIDTFVRDESPDAWNKVIERLLASPQYGERWGRHWLDVARYSDSNGLDENLAFANAYHYRDYVVRAFNDDKRYDVFVTEQLAGDLLPAPRNKQKLYDQLTATSFLALGPKVLAEPDKTKLVMDVVDEQLDVMGKALMGLTLGCARCHDHKFDPVPTADYYRLAGILKSTQTVRWLDKTTSRWLDAEVGTAAEKADAAAWKQQFTKVDEPYQEARANAEQQVLKHLTATAAQYLLSATAARAMSHVVEAEAFARGNLNVDKRRWGSRDRVVVHTIRPGVQYVEYDFTLPAGGRFVLEARYASEQARPMRLLVNGQTFPEPVMGQTTGGYMPQDQRWFRVAALDMQPGKNVIRLDRNGDVPHLDKVRLVALANVKENAWPLVGPFAHDLNQAVARVWLEFLERAETNPLLEIWNAYAQLPESEFAARAPGVAKDLRQRRAAGKLDVPDMAAGLIEGLPPQSLAELAGRYQVLISQVVTAIADRRQDIARIKRADPEEMPDMKLPSAVLESLRRGLFGENDGPFALPETVVEGLYPPDVARTIGKLRVAVEAAKKRKPQQLSQTMAVKEGIPTELPIHVRGSHLSLASEVQPRGFLRVADHCLAPPSIPADVSGRLQLARWLTHPDHPLTARVMVNRIWQGHFGEGIVRSTSNFGLRGEKPTHPALLDWLAREFQRQGWSIKAMHRLILRSAAYRMDSRVPTSVVESSTLTDPENRLLWRFPQRRLQAEEVRDAMLAVAGNLDRTMGGTLLETRNGAYVTNDQSASVTRYDSFRRSIYLPIIRNDIFPFFSAFDYSDPSVSIDHRPSSVVPQQALLLMNSPFALEQGARLVARIEQQADDDRAARIAGAYQLALGRSPTAEEAGWAASFLQRVTPLVAAGPRGEAQTRSEETWRQMVATADGRALQAFVQVLFASNEFLHID